jgi:hypothetical protein
MNFITVYLCTVFKQSAAIFLIFAFVAQTFSGGFVMLNYYTNTAAFAKNCENKAKPKLHCNGKCQVMKKLQQEEQQDQQNSERKSVNKIEALSSSSFFYSSATAFFLVSCRVVTIEKKIPLSTMSYSFFHPPQV